MSKKMTWSLLIIFSLLMMVGSMMAAPQPVNSPFNNDIGALTGVGYTYAVAKNLVYWESDTNATTDKAYNSLGDSSKLLNVTQATHSAYGNPQDTDDDDYIPSHYQWNSSADRLNRFGSYTPSTRNHINRLGDGRYRIVDEGAVDDTLWKVYSVPVMNIDLKVDNANVHLYGLTITVVGNSDFNPYEDLLPLNGSVDDGWASGLQIYHENDWNVGTNSSKDYMDRNDDIIEWRGSRADRLDSTMAHYTNVTSFTYAGDPVPANYGGGHLTRGTAVYDFNDVAVSGNRTWIPFSGLDDYFMGINHPRNLAALNEWYGWQTYVEFGRPVDIQNLNAGATLPFIRFWVAARPSGCCDSPEGSMDPSLGVDLANAAMTNRANWGDEFFFGMFPDLFGPWMGTQDGEAYSPYRILPGTDYTACPEILGGGTTWEPDLFEVRPSLLLRPRTKTGAAAWTTVDGSEASWNNKANDNSVPAMWDVPGLIHGWQGNVGPVVAIVDPMVSTAYATVDYTDDGDAIYEAADWADDMAIPTGNRYAYSSQQTATQGGVYTNVPPYTTDSIQVITWVMQDLDNCADDTTIHIAVDTGNSVFDNSADWFGSATSAAGITNSDAIHLGIDSVIFIDDDNRGINQRTNELGNVIDYSTVNNDPSTYADARALLAMGGAGAHPFVVTNRANCGVTLIRDTALCVDTLIFNIYHTDMNLTAVGETDLRDFVWRDGMVVTARLYVKDRGGNTVYTNYSKATVNNNFVGRPTEAWITAGYVETRFAVDLSAPIAKMTCPEYINRPGLDYQPIRVVNTTDPIIRIEIKDAFLSDTTNSATKVVNCNGENLYPTYQRSGGINSNAIYVHDDNAHWDDALAYHSPTYAQLTSGIWRTNNGRDATLAPAPGTGFDTTNFAILLTVWDCDNSLATDDRFDPTNFGWDDDEDWDTDAQGIWEGAAAQVFIWEVEAANGVTYAKDATNPQNGILSINLADDYFDALGADTEDGDVILVEIVDAALVAANRVAWGHAAVRSDGIHDQPNILWSRYTINDNQSSTDLDADAEPDYAAATANADDNGVFLRDDNWWYNPLDAQNVPLNYQTFNFPTGVNGANHEAFNEELCERFKFRFGNFQANFNYAFGNPNKHFLRLDETDSDDDGDHDAPEYEWQVGLAGAGAEGDFLGLGWYFADDALLDANLDVDGREQDGYTYASDTLGWFYVDMTGPIVDLESVYPFMRRTDDGDATWFENNIDGAVAGHDEVATNAENLYSYTSDPYQVISLDLADLSCRFYSRDFAAGMSMSSVKMRIKVTACDGTYHPWFGPNGTVFSIGNGNLVSADEAPADCPAFYFDRPTDLNEGADGAVVTDQAADRDLDDDGTPDIVEKVLGRVGGTNADDYDLAAVTPQTRIVFDARLGARDTENRLGFGTSEPRYRFRDGDMVCVSVYATDVATGDCDDNNIGNEIINEAASENGNVITDSNYFKYTFAVDTKEPTIAIQNSNNWMELGCNNAYVDIRLSDVCDECFQSNQCGDVAAGVDSLFLQLEFTPQGSATSQLNRIAVGISDLTNAANEWDPVLEWLNPGMEWNLNNAAATDLYGAFLEDAEITADAAVDADLHKHNEYASSANEKAKFNHYTLRLWFNCDYVDDGDMIKISAWGRDAIDVPWYPINSGWENGGQLGAADLSEHLFPQAFDRVQQLGAINHWSTADGDYYYDDGLYNDIEFDTYNYRRHFEHPNFDIDTARLNGTTAEWRWDNNTTPTRTWGYFTQKSPADFWWQGPLYAVANGTNDWRTGVNATAAFLKDSTNTVVSYNYGNSDTRNRMYGFQYIHWYNVCPWALDYLAQRDSLLTIGANKVGSYRIAGEHVGDNNLWDRGDVGTVDDAWVPGSNWTDVFQYDMTDYDWTDLDSIMVANAVHHNWAKPVESNTITVVSNSNLSRVYDEDWSTRTAHEDWAWSNPAATNIAHSAPYAASYGDVIRAAVVGSDVDGNVIRQYRTGLVDTIMVDFRSCWDFNYCHEPIANDTTVGFAMECYDKDGNIKWYWPYKVDDIRYGTGNTHANWEAAFATDKAAANASGFAPIAYRWFDCDCPGCNGVRWAALADSGYCGANNYRLTVDLNQLITWKTNGDSVWLSRGNTTTAYADGDSVICYTYLSTTATDVNADDHKIITSWYYLIDQMAPVANFNDIEMYTPTTSTQLVGTVFGWNYYSGPSTGNIDMAVTARTASLATPEFLGLSAKGEQNMGLEAKRYDFVRMGLANAMDYETQRTIAGTQYISKVGLTGTATDVRHVIGKQEAGVLLDGNVWTQDAPDANVLNIPNTIWNTHYGEAYGGGYRDTTYWGAVYVHDQRTNVREYIDTLKFYLQDRLGNTSTYTRTYVVDNILPKMVWNYCNGNLNKQMNLNETGNDGYFGYWLNGEGTNTDYDYTSEMADFVDTLGLAIYQASDATTTWEWVDVLALKGHRSYTPNTDNSAADADTIKNVCKGQIYVVVNFNDLMYTSKLDGHTFSSAGAVKIKPQTGAWKNVSAIAGDQVTRFAEKLAGWGNVPILVAQANMGEAISEIAVADSKDREMLAEKSKNAQLSAKYYDQDGWLDENTWVGGIYIDTTTGWNGTARMSVVGFYDKAGNKMVEDTSLCFYIEFMTSQGDIIIANPDADDIYPDAANSCQNYIMMEDTVINRSAVSSHYWFYATNGVYGGDYGADNQFDAPTAFNAFGSVTPATNAATPKRVLLSQDRAVVYTYFQGNAATYTDDFVTRQDVQFKAAIAGMSGCVDSIAKTVAPIEVDFEDPAVSILTADINVRTAVSSYRNLYIESEYYDDVTAYYDTDDATQAALAFGEITAVSFAVKDITRGDAAFTTIDYATYTDPTPETGLGWALELDSLVKYGLIASVYDSLHIQLTATDNACNTGTAVVPVPRLIYMPALLVRGRSHVTGVDPLEDAVRSAKFEGLGAGYAREIWPPFFMFNESMEATVTDAYTTPANPIRILDSLQVTTFTHYNEADMNPDVNDPFGHLFTTTKRDYPGDSLYLVYFDEGNYLGATDDVFFIVEGAEVANGIYNPGVKFSAQAENPEWELAAQQTTVDGVTFWYAKLELEDEDYDQDQFVQVTVRVDTLTTGKAYSKKFTDYTWFLLDTEDPIYDVTYTDDQGVDLKQVATAVQVLNTESQGGYSVDKTLADAGDMVWITNGQRIHALVDMNQTMSALGEPVEATARMWKHINVDFEAPTQVNMRSSDEAFQIDVDTQTYSNFNNWLDKDSVKIYDFMTLINNSNPANSGFAWVKVEERDAAGNYVRDWSTDKCTGLVVYLDTKKPSAPNAEKLGAYVPTALAANNGYGADKAGIQVQAMESGVTVFGYVGAAIDDSWPTSLTQPDNSVTVYIYEDATTATPLATAVAKNDGSFTVNIADATEDDVFYVAIADYAGNMSDRTMVTTTAMITQMIPLNQGWNLFSVNVMGDDLQKVLKNENAGLYANSFFYFYTEMRDGTIKSYKKEDMEALQATDLTVSLGEDNLAYWIYMLNADTLEVTGTPVDPVTEIELADGVWNYVAYLPTTSAKISGAFSVATLENVDAIASDAWRTDVVEGVAASDNMMYPGKGYLVLPGAEGVTIAYAAQGALAKAETAPARVSEMVASRYMQAFTGEAMFYGKPAYEGDKVEVFNANGVKCGEGSVDKNGRYEILVYGDDPVSDADEGIALGETFIVRINNEEAVFDNAPLYAGDLSKKALNLNVQKPLPKVFSLNQNVPNPFNPSTIISYDVPKAAHVSLVIYNNLGERVCALVNGAKEPGTYTIRWNGENQKGEKVASGVYFYKMKAGDFEDSRQMMLVK